MAKFVKTDASGNKASIESFGNLAVVETITANRTLRVEDSGKIFLIATDALTITLPSTVAGLFP